MDIGHGHTQSVLLMYLWSALLSGAALAVGRIDNRPLVAMILLGVAALFLVTALPRLARRRSGNGHHEGSSNGRAAGTVSDAKAPQGEPDASDAPERNLPEHP
jgi:UDP-GlcNAc:undecaprenyl-phosphate GlcNAc-1-phosphate transferase